MGQNQRLTGSQYEQLAQLETVIERGLQTFVDVGTALLQIRDEDLYKGQYSRFEDYCRERWGFSRSRAHRLIEAAQVADNLLPTGNIPQAERQIRPLAKLDPDMQREVWAKIRA